MLFSAVATATVALSSASTLTVQHALADGPDGPIFSPRGSLTIAPDRAAFDQTPLSSNDATALKVCIVIYNVACLCMS